MVRVIVSSEDVGQGILHGDNTYSYDLAPVSSPTGFLHWAKKTLKELLGPFAFVTEGLGYMSSWFYLYYVYLQHSKKSKPYC